jgi:hypothetical protein
MHKLKIFFFTKQAWPPVLILNPKILGSIPKQLKKRASDEFNERSSTLLISTKANDRSSGEQKPAKINELRAKNKDCENLIPLKKKLQKLIYSVEKEYQ